MGKKNKTRDKKKKKKVARDRPIYLYVEVKADDNSVSCLWFVIEDGRRPRQISGSEEIDDDDKVIFRRLDLPEFDDYYLRLPRSVVVLDSRLFMIGGSQCRKRDCSVESYIGYDYLDLKPSYVAKEWRSEQGVSFPSQQSVARYKDGRTSIFTPIPLVLIITCLVMIWRKTSGTASLAVSGVSGALEW
ncbi:hypothetical protein RchiOBHm_Chr5g0049591 [Rosa chinensis]|uniref:Uncharacterized protein n=1 Tax=Rosa chinensis TaxID=74649 RepID=A0A2P6QEW2_ROSCH|nr:hypothetical protein RchiOBHm_Chr5g0049591 [Rosa chinensis]